MSLPYTGVGNLGVAAIVLVILASFGINTRYHKVHALEGKDQEHLVEMGGGGRDEGAEKNGGVETWLTLASQT